MQQHIEKHDKMYTLLHLLLLWVEDELTAVGRTASMLYWCTRVYLLTKPSWTEKGRRGDEEPWLAKGRINGRGTGRAWGGLLEEVYGDNAAANVE